MTGVSLVSYELLGTTALLTMDDGKANVMSMDMQRALVEALDRADADHAVVVLAGRSGMFSGGYDRALFACPPGEIVRTIRAGGELVHRLLARPWPVVAACTGHAIAQGAFLLLGADVRVGASGPFKIGLNEVRIGLTIPIYGVEVARQRLTPPWFNHATMTGELYPPQTALGAGFLDRLVEPADVVREAIDEARRLATIDMAAHAATKLRVRGAALAAMRDGIDHEARFADQPALEAAGGE